MLSKQDRILIKVFRVEKRIQILTKFHRKTDQLLLFIVNLVEYMFIHDMGHFARASVRLSTARSVMLVM